MNLVSRREISSSLFMDKKLFHLYPCAKHAFKVKLHLNFNKFANMKVVHDLNNSMLSTTIQKAALILPCTQRAL